MKSLPAFVFLLCVSSVGAAEEAPGTGNLLVEDNFERAELGKSWHINTGEWTIVDGVLRAKELQADQHSAAARRIIETGDAVYQMRFRFVAGGKALHFGFDPKRGELKKKGHLFSVIITPNQWSIMKHVDKDRPQEDPNQVLATEARSFNPDTWHTLQVTTQGTEVTAKINGTDSLQASHPTFSVKKPTLVFRCIGDGVELDDIKVWQKR